MRIGRIALWTILLLGLGWWFGPLGPSRTPVVELGPSQDDAPSATEAGEAPVAKLVQVARPNRTVGDLNLESVSPPSILVNAVVDGSEHKEIPALTPGTALLSIRVTGWVQEHEGLPVRVEVSDGRRALATLVGWPNQTFLVPNLMPGKYQVEARTPTAPRLISPLESVELANGQQARLDLRLQPCSTLRGVITSRDGTVLKGYNLVATHSSLPDTREALSLVDDRGVFEVYAGFPMPVEVRIHAPGHLAFAQSVDMGPGEVRWVQWTLEPQRPVGGIVRWPDGTPAADVSLFGRTDREGDQTSSDEKGRFKLEALSLRDLKLYARGGGESGQDFSNRWSFHESEDLTRLDLWLQPSAEYRARVLTDEGAAVAGQRLMLLAVDNRRVTRFGTTDDEGRATVSGLYPGTYTVIFDRYEQALTEITVQPGELLPEQLLRLPTDLSDKLRQAAASPPREW